MAVIRVVKVINGQDFVIGMVIECRPGEFWFIPRVSGRKPSRKPHAIAMDSIPKWARDMADRIDILATRKDRNR